MSSADRENNELNEDPAREPARAEAQEEVAWVPPPDLEPLPTKETEAPEPEDSGAVEPELFEPDSDVSEEEAEEESDLEAGEESEDEEFDESDEDESDLDDEDEEEEGEDDEAPEGEEETESGDEEQDEESGDKPKTDKPRRRRKRKTPRVKTPEQAKAILECLLFAAVEPMSLKQIREYVHPMKPNEIQALIVELQNEYDNRAGGLQIVEVAGGYQMATRPSYADWVSPMFRRKRRTGLSPAMLETLAIISYKQPLIRAELDAIRGVDSSGVIRGLQDMGLVDIVGQKQVPGRPNMYGTTSAFLKYFGLKSLSDLPSIEALRQQFELTQG